MKAFIVTAVFALFMAGGVPGLHGVDGMTFGNNVQTFAETDPSGFVSHVQAIRGHVLGLIGR